MVRTFRTLSFAKSLSGFNVSKIRKPGVTHATWMNGSKDTEAPLRFLLGSGPEIMPDHDSTPALSATGSPCDGPEAIDDGSSSGSRPAAIRVCLQSSYCCLAR